MTPLMMIVLATLFGACSAWPLTADMHLLAKPVCEPFSRTLSASGPSVARSPTLAIRLCHWDVWRSRTCRIWASRLGRYMYIPGA